MPKRKALVEIPSDEVQGEGSWVRYRPIKYGDARKAWGMSKENVSDEQSTEEVHNLILVSLVDWNWVDDDDNPLPLPKTEEDLDTLYTHELVFLSKALVDVSDKLKN